MIKIKLYVFIIDSAPYLQTDHVTGHFPDNLYYFPFANENGEVFPGLNW